MSQTGVLVFGASGVIGLELCQKLAAAGQNVFAVIRGESKESELREAGAEIVKADLLDAASVEDAVSSVAGKVDCVVSVFGARPFTPPETWPEWPGNKAITDACLKHGPKKFVLMTSIGCGGSWDYQTEGMLNFLGPFLREKNKAEEYLQKSGLDWIILRPGGLSKPDNVMEPLPPSGNGIMLETEALRGAIGRGDVVDMLVELVGPKGEKALGRILHAVDRDMVFTDEEIVPFELD